ncbi:MAG: glycosyltransferase [Candidatus Kerfeldbacteria bacterium]|nr:glycosyltransferase [Candidatus Kerfeldbacteria bacterium]
MSTPQLSIIIVNYRSSDALEHCLRSLHVATKASVEVIVVDNSPEEPTRDILHQSGWHGHYFSQERNVGYTLAANFGAQHAAGEYICFLNPDTVLEAHCLDRLMVWIEQHPRSVAGPRERDADGHIVTTAFPPVSRRAIWGANLLYKLPWPRSWHPALPWLIPSYQYADLCRTADEAAAVPVLSGSCLVMAAATWREVGEWNDELTYFGLESEWFARALDHGVRAWYIPEAVMFHEHATSIKRALPSRVRDEADHNRRWHAKRFGWVTLLILAGILWLEHTLRPASQSKE